MASIIYKKDENGNIIQDKVPAQFLQSALDAGWTANKSELDGTAELVEEAVEESPEPEESEPEESEPVKPRRRGRPPKSAQ